MREPILIEQTAKRWKTVQAVGVGLLLFGLLLMPTILGGAGHPYAVAMMLTTGVSTWITGRIGGWWHSG